MPVHKIYRAYLMYTEGTVNFFYQYFHIEFIQVYHVEIKQLVLLTDEGVTL
jgi:hypothetical protein